MLVSQIRSIYGDSQVVVRQVGEQGAVVNGATSLYQLAMDAIKAGKALEQTLPSSS